MFAITSSFLWILVSLYSIGYMRALNEHAQTRYYFMFALAIFSAVSIAMSENLVTFYIFYEALTLSTYWLVAHHEDEEAFAATRKYLAYLLVSGWFLFSRGGPDLRPRRHDRLCRRRHPAIGFGAPIHPGHAVRAVCPGLHESGLDALSRLAAQRHGGTDAGQCAAACRGRGQGRGVRLRSHRLPRLRRRPGRGTRHRGLARRRGIDHHAGRVRFSPSAKTT